MTDPALSRQRRWQLKMEQNGRCMICGVPATTRRLCGQHAAARTARQVRWRRESWSAEKVLATNLLNRAIAAGWIRRPSCCSRCQKSSPKIHGHHPDYEKPLEVVWLCPSCHSAVHRAEAAAPNPA